MIATDFTLAKYNLTNAIRILETLSSKKEASVYLKSEIVYYITTIIMLRSKLYDFATFTECSIDIDDALNTIINDIKAIIYELKQQNYSKKYLMKLHKALKFLREAKRQILW